MAGQLHVIYNGNRPYELPESDRDTTDRLMDHDDGIGAEYAHASTNRRYAIAMMRALPELLDDPDLASKLHIVSLELPNDVPG